MKLSLERLNHLFFLLLSILCLFLSAGPSEAAEVIVIGDTRLKPVVDIVAGIKETLASPIKVYSPSDVRGKLKAIAQEEGARAVIALGKDAIDDAVQLPSSIAVIFDLVIVPPRTTRQNTTGLFMGTPVAEYVNLLNKYLPSLKRISVVGSQGLLNILGADRSGVSILRARNSFELVDAVNKLNDADALLLLPDVSLLTDTALEEIYLYSFRRKVPILGISDKYVRQGALLALMFNPKNVGRRLGDLAKGAIDGADIGAIGPSPSDNFDLFINRDTAAKMGISIPQELLDRAKRVYP
jgi:putative ABC transport system substrate-binding protein